MKKKVIILLSFVIILSFVLYSITQAKKSHYENPNLNVNSVNLSGYTNKNGVAIFNTQITITNSSTEPQYFIIKGDFETEYKLFMIKERILVGYDSMTGFRCYFLPANSYATFDVSFSVDSYENRKKPDRSPPEIIIESISKNEVNTSEIVTNFSIGADGTITEQEKTVDGSKPLKK